MAGGSWTHTGSSPWASSTTNNPIDDAYGDAEFSDISVTITPFFHWVPGSDPSAPPTILRAKVRSEAYAGDENGGSVSADNGFGDVSHPDYLPGGYVFYDDCEKASVGTHLEQKDPQGQTLVSLPPQTLSASGGRANDWQDISSEVIYQADTDDRVVTLHRNGARGETQDPDGTVHGDSIYSYLDYDNNGPDNSTRQSGDYLNWQTFYPTFYGDWHLQQYSPYSWTPDESDDTAYLGKVSMHYRNYSTFEGQPDNGVDAAEQRTISYTTTDTDGASATANYILTIHDPYEHLVDSNRIIHKNLRRLPFSPSWTSSAAAQSGTVYIEQAQTWGGSISLDGPGEWILNTLGVSIEANYSYSVNAGASANAGPFPPGYSTYALVYDEYVDYTGTLKLWDAGGYVGTQNYEEQVPNGQIGIQAADPIWTGSGTPPPLH